MKLKRLSSKNHPSIIQIKKKVGNTGAFKFRDVSQEVFKLLKNLNPNKASGPDEQSPKLLKELHKEIAPILTCIYKSSIETGIVPQDWRSATVAPIYKKGPKCKPSNYRPISLTCISSKLIKHILVCLLRSMFRGGLWYN